MQKSYQTLLCRCILWERLHSRMCNEHEPAIYEFIGWCCTCGFALFNSLLYDLPNWIDKIIDPPGGRLNAQPEFVGPLFVNQGSCPITPVPCASVLPAARCGYCNVFMLKLSLFSSIITSLSLFCGHINLVRIGRRWPIKVRMHFLGCASRTSLVNKVGQATEFLL